MNKVMKHRSYVPNLTENTLPPPSKPRKRYKSEEPLVYLIDNGDLYSIAAHNWHAYCRAHSTATFIHLAQHKGKFLTKNPINITCWKPANYAAAAAEITRLASRQTTDTLGLLGLPLPLETETP